MFKTTLAIALFCAIPITGYSAEELGEPEILIRQMADKVIHEYSVHGFIYAIKVIPTNGKPYFLVAENGEHFINTAESNVLIPKWTIFSWQ